MFCIHEDRFQGLSHPRTDERNSHSSGTKRSPVVATLYHRLKLLAITMILFATFVGCTSSRLASSKIGFHLDRIANKLEDFGTVTVSGATLIEPDPRFQLDLNLTGEDIFNRNRVEGFSRIFTQESADLQLSVRAEMIQGVANQLMAAQDPKLRDQLKNLLASQLFKGLVEQAPLAQRAKWAKVAEQFNQAMSGKSTEEDSGVEIGEVEAEAAVKAAASAAAEFANAIAIDVKNTDEDHGENDAKKVLSFVQETLQHASKARSQADKAARLAKAAAHTAQGKLESQDATSVEEAAALITRAVSDAAKAKTVAGTLANSINKAQGEIAELAISKNAKKQNNNGNEETFDWAEWANKLRLAVKPVIEQEEKAADPPKTEKDQGDTGLPSNGDSNKSGPTESSTSSSTPTSTTVLEVAEAAVQAVNSTRQAAAVAKIRTKAPSASEEDRNFDVPDLPSMDSRVALDRALSFSDPLPAYEGPLNLNLQQLLALTGSDKALLNMLKWNSYPTNYGPGNRVFLAMASVSVVPGRKTYKGYMGQVDVFMEYGLMCDGGVRECDICKEAADRVETSNEKHEKKEQPADERSNGVESTVPTSVKNDSDRLQSFRRRSRAEWNRHIRPICGDAQPTALAVFPFVNSQVLDLRASRRQAFSTAIQLMLSGYPAAGNALLDYVRQTEEDTATLTALNTVSSYGNGSHIGFTFSPNYRAQAKPGGFGSDKKAGQRMQPWSFPVIVLISADERVFAERRGVRPNLLLKHEDMNKIAQTADSEINELFRKYVDSPESAGASRTFQEFIKGWLFWPSRTDFEKTFQSILEELRIHNVIYHDEKRRVEDIEFEHDLFAATVSIFNEYYQNYLEAKSKIERKLLVDLSAAEAEEQLNAKRGQIEVLLSMKIVELFRHAPQQHLMFAETSVGPRYLLWHQTHRWVRDNEGWAFGLLDWRRYPDRNLFGLDALYELEGAWKKAHREGVKQFKENGDDRLVLQEDSGFASRWRGYRPDWSEAVIRRTRAITDAAFGTTIPLRLPVFDHSTKSDFLSFDDKVAVEPGTGWVNRPSTFFIKHENRPFTGDYMVSVGGRRVNATKLSNGVLQITVPPWLETFDRETAKRLVQEHEGNGQSELLQADVVVTDGVRVFTSDPINFKYYAPTPEISVMADPAVEFGNLPPQARLSPHSVTVKTGEALDFAVVLSKSVRGVETAKLQIILGTPPESSAKPEDAPKLKSGSIDTSSDDAPSSDCLPSEKKGETKEADTKNSKENSKEEDNKKDRANEIATSGSLEKKEEQGNTESEEPAMKGSVQVELELKRVSRSKYVPSAAGDDWASFFRAAKSGVHEPLGKSKDITLRLELSNGGFMILSVAGHFVPMSK